MNCERLLEKKPWQKQINPHSKRITSPLFQPCATDFCLSGKASLLSDFLVEKDGSITVL